MQKEKPSLEGTALDFFLIDTHVAVWLAQGDSRIEKRRRVLQVAYEKQRLFVSAISAWEIGMLVAKERLSLPKSPLMWFDELVSKFGLQVIDVNSQIAMQSNFLPGKFHGDPADRIIIATAQSLNSVLITADKAIIAYSKSGVIRSLSLSK